MALFGLDIKDAGEAVKSVGTLAKDIRAAITGKEILDPDTELKLQALDVEVMKAQLEIAKAEATHTSMFVAGARPAILWIGALVILYSYIIAPVLKTFGAPVPDIQLGDLWPVITGILGLGTMRTYEKAQGVVGKH